LFYRVTYDSFAGFAGFAQTGLFMKREMPILFHKKRAFYSTKIGMASCHSNYVYMLLILVAARSLPGSYIA